MLPSPGKDRKIHPTFIILCIICLSELQLDGGGGGGGEFNPSIFLTK